MTFLNQRGHNFIKTQRDRNNPNMIVWIFIDTPDLQESIKEYYNRDYFKNNIKDN